MPKMSGNKTQKKQKKRTKAQQPSPSAKKQSLAFYSTSIATIPRQSFKKMRIRGGFLKLPGGMFINPWVSVALHTVAYNDDIEVRNQIYQNFIHELHGPSAWLDALEFASICRAVRAEFLPFFFSSRSKIWFQLDNITKLIEIYSFLTPLPSIVDIIESQGKKFKINLKDYDKVHFAPLLPMVMQLRERPNMMVRFKDFGYRKYSRGGTARDLTYLTKALRERSAETDEILSELELVEVKAPGVWRLVARLHEVAFPLTQGWFIHITFKSTLAWWDDEIERKRRVQQVARVLGLQPSTFSFMGEHHLLYKGWVCV